MPGQDLNAVPPPQLALAARLRGIGRRVRWLGLLVSFATLLQRIARPIAYVEIFRVFTKDLSEPSIAEASSRPPALQVRVLGSDSADSAVYLLVTMGGSFPECEITADLIQKRLERGDRIALATLPDGPAVGYSWLTHQSPVRLEDAGCLLALRPGECYTFDAFVDPAQRGLGLYAALEGSLLNWAASNGHKRNLTMVSVLNPQSLKTQAKLGKRKLLTIYAVQVPGSRKSRVFGSGQEFAQRISQP